MKYPLETSKKSTLRRQNMTESVDIIQYYVNSCGMITPTSSKFQGWLNTKIECDPYPSDNYELEILWTNCGFKFKNRPCKTDILALA